MSNHSVLEDYLELVTYGFTNPMPDSDDGPWKITAKDVINGEINFSTARKTTQEAFDTKLTKKSRPQVGDVLLTKDGTLGRLAIVQKEDICINQSVAVLRPNKKILPEYLFYLLSTPEYQRRMIGDSDGTVIKHIYITRVGKMEVDIPSVDEQRDRLKHLLAIDRKIKLNRQTNQTLENIAQAIFKSWFVDFEPTRAKIAAKEEWARKNPTESNDKNAEAKYIQRAAMAAIAGKTIEEIEALEAEQDVQGSTNTQNTHSVRGAGPIAGAGATLKQLQTTADLFPDALVDSELGEIPEGWEISKLSATAKKIGSGATPRGGKGAYKQEGLSQIRSMNVFNGAFSFKDLAKIDEEQAEKLKNVEVEENDVLINITGASVARCCIVPPSVLPARVNQHVCIVRANNTKISPYYIYQSLVSFSGKSFLVNIAQAGATREALTKSDLENFKVLLPVGELMKIFNAKVEKVEKMRFKLVDINLSLEKLRDALLPKLLSGELPLITETNMEEAC